MMEPGRALSYVAAQHRDRVPALTRICLVPQRNPVYTAKQIADVDFLSGGVWADFGASRRLAARRVLEALQVPCWRGARTSDYIRVMQAL